MTTIRFIASNPGANARVFAEIEGLENITRKAIRKSWIALGRALKIEANREILRKPKSGRVYFIRTAGGRTRRHVASAPGETHANMFGPLRKSLGYKVRGMDMEFGYGASGKDTPRYAKYVEFGTTKMGARPSLLNAIEANQRNAETYFYRAMNDELKR